MLGIECTSPWELIFWQVNLKWIFRLSCIGIEANRFVIFAWIVTMPTNQHQSFYTTDKLFFKTLLRWTSTNTKKLLALLTKRMTKQPDRTSTSVSREKSHYKTGLTGIEVCRTFQYFPTWFTWLFWQWGDARLLINHLNWITTVIIPSILGTSIFLGVHLGGDMIVQESSTVSVPMVRAYYESFKSC